jgi:hypothetical protein
MPAHAHGSKPADNGLSLGIARRDAAHAQAEAEHGPTLLFARRMFVLWLLQNGSGTADDVQDLIELPPTVNPTVLGAVPVLFARRRWIVAVGYQKSRRPQAHARPVTRWKLVDAAALSAWLQAHPMPTPAEVLA